MSVREGKIVQVNIRSAGGFLVADYIAGTTSILIDNVDAYPELGGRVIIDTALYDYTSVDKASGEMVLAAGLVADVEHATQAVLFPIAEEKIATVRTLAPEEALSCRVPHSLYDKIPDGIREVNDQEAVYVTNDKRGWYITDLIAKEAGIDGAYILPGTVTTGDDLPPAYAPVPHAYGGLSAIFLRVDPIANGPDPVQYEWHVVPDDATVPTAGDAATVLTVGPETQVMVRYGIDGVTQFPYDAPTWFRVFAKDDDGYGPVSEPVSAQPVQLQTPDIVPGSITDVTIADDAITAPKIRAEAVEAGKIAADAVDTAQLVAGSVKSAQIFSDAVTADKIHAGAVTADALESLLILATTIKVGTGNNFTIDPTNGLLIQLPNGGKISLPTSGTNAEFRKVILDATDLLVEDNFELRGASNRISGTLKMSTGVDTPTTGPSLSPIWPPVTLGPLVGSAYYRGLYDDGVGHWLTAWSSGSMPSSDAQVRSIDKATGAQATVASAAALGIATATEAIYDYTRLGSTNYVLIGPYAGSSKPYRVAVFDNAWAQTGGWRTPTVSGRNPAVIANDGTDLFIGYTSTTGGDASIQMFQIPSTGAATRQNLIPNPSFEVDISNWSVGPNTALSRSNTVGGQVGSYAGRVSSVEQRTNLMTYPLHNVGATGLTGWGAGSGTASITPNGSWLRANAVDSGLDRFIYVNSPVVQGVVAGQSYFPSYTIGGGSPGAYSPGLLTRYYDAGGTQLAQFSDSVNGYVTNLTGQRLVFPAHQAPAGATQMAIFPYAGMSGAAGADYFELKEVMIAKSGESSAFFSGDSGAGYYWTGAGNGSSSVYHPATDCYIYSPFMTVTAALNYVASAYSQGSAARGIVTGINWYDASNNSLGASNPAASNDAVGAFTRFNSGAPAAPAGAAKAIVVLYVMALPRGEYHYFDAVLFEQASALGAYFDGATVVGGQNHMWLGAANASASEESIATSIFTTPSSGSPISSPYNVWVGTADLGSKHFVISSGNGASLWTPAGARGSTQTDREWGLVGGAPTIGLAWDGTNFIALTYTAQGAGSFQNYLTALGTYPTARAISARYSQYDSNATGGTHETAWSNATALTLPARQRLQVITPAPQGTGSVDEPDRIRHYIQIGGAGDYYRQNDVTASPWTVVYDAISTAGATAVSSPDFTGLGNPGLVQSAKLDAWGFPVWQLRGDGVVHMMVGEVKAMAGIYAPLGTLKCDGTSYLRSIYPQLFNNITFTKVTDAASHPSGINAVYIADTSNIAPGQQVEGAGIPNGTTVVSVNTNVNIIISNNTTAAIAGATITFLPHGAVDSTHFNVPDYRGRTLVGADGTPEFAGVGTKYGEKTHILVTAEMPKHSHGGISGYIDTDHAHNVSSDGAGGAVVGTSSRRFTNGTGDYAPNGSVFNTSVSGVTANHRHGITAEGGADPAVPGSGGHNNIQPSAAINWVIAW